VYLDKLSSQHLKNIKCNNHILNKRGGSENKLINFGFYFYCMCVISSEIDIVKAV
jgi:hypothetical protein